MDRTQTGSEGHAIQPPSLRACPKGREEGMRQKEVNEATASATDVEKAKEEEEEEEEGSAAASG